MFFFKKNADISKFKRALVLRGMFSETKFVCVITCQSWRLYQPWLGWTYLGVLSTLKFIYK